ncbi:MAG: glycosyltransferase [Xenococcaceae cyanobacterium MO_167.B27]|nr:glycosyltransferase [Xenococcaceae cyanobacterium MO_167.B27]
MNEQKTSLLRLKYYNKQQKKRAIFTICSNNYLPYVRVLFNSLKKYHPESELFLCLADKKDHNFPLKLDNIQIVEAEKLNITNFLDFAFRYDIMEFNTALKPFMMQLLIEEYKFEQVIYLDPDIELFAPMESVVSALDNGADFVITPHITQPSEGDAYPGDIGVMQSGIYNLGFIAVSNSKDVISFIHWWGRKLRFQCVNDQLNGIFVDQKFINLLPAFYDKVKILRDTNLNVAYWNLVQRKLEKKDNNWYIDEKPLVFFHFSGININNNKLLSKHTTAFSNNLPDALQLLINDYIQKVKQNSFAVNCEPKYSYGYFDNGIFIPPIARKIYRNLENIWFPNPFANFYEYLNLLHHKYKDASSFPLTNLMLGFLENTSCLDPYFKIDPDYDLKEYPYFNMDKDYDREKYTSWFLDHAEKNEIDDFFIEPILDNIIRKFSYSRSPISPTRANKSLVNVVGYLRTEIGIGQAARMVIKSLNAVNISTQGYHLDIYDHLVPQNDRQVESLIVSKISAPIHIYKFNAQRLETIKQGIKKDSNKPDFVINMPAWELSKFPQDLVSGYHDIDEVWVESKFVQRAFQAKLNIPVLCMPPAINIGNVPNLNRDHFNLPKDKFLFHFNFDFASFDHRKNPQDIIDAYRMAFRKQSHIPTALIIKTRGFDPEGKSYQKLLEIIDGEDDIIVINDYFRHGETMALMNCCDSYVSLHRSEGFGYTLAEAMLLGKPVIATNYSGSRDFINHQTGFPVDYKLIALKPEEYPFATGQKWAQPDLHHAAWLMKKMVNNSHETKQIALAGQEKIVIDHSPINAGKRYLKRLQQLGLI